MNIKKVLLTIISISLKMICIAIAIMAIYTVGIKAYDFGVKLFAETSVDEAPGTDVRITISKGMTSSDIADELAKKGVIESSLAFKIKAKLVKFDKHIADGTYTLNTSMKMSDIMDIIEEKYEEESSIQAVEDASRKSEELNATTAVQSDDSTEETTIAE